MAEAGGAANGWAQAFSIMGDIFNSIGNAYQAKAQAQAAKFSYQQQAMQAQFKADVGRLNAQIAASEGTRQQIAFAQQMGVRGMQVAQQMANTRVQQSHSGVRMDSTSSQQVRASQRFSHAVDMATAEQNRIEMLNKSQSNVTNYLAQAGIDQATANVNSNFANAISPSASFNAALMAGLFQTAQKATPGFFEDANENLQKINLTQQNSNISPSGVGGYNGSFATNYSIMGSYNGSSYGIGNSFSSGMSI